MKKNPFENPMISLERMRIRKGEEKDWAQFKRVNCHDAYSSAVLSATQYFGQVLDAGRSPKEADDFISNLGLSISQANFVIQNIVHFHPRGEEVKAYWNKINGYKGDGLVVSNMFKMLLSKLK
jgi:hypothetical protein